MSLTLSITTPYGIVLAADSRQTAVLFNQAGQFPRIGSDSATKIFSVPKKHIGITVAGPAFLPDPELNGAQRSIGALINDHIETLGDDATVKSVHDGLVIYLKKVYADAQLDQMEASLRQDVEKVNSGKITNIVHAENGTGFVANFTTKDGKEGRAEVNLMPISLIVAGYDTVEGKKSDKYELSSYVTHVPGGTSRSDERNNFYGCTWTGQAETVMRVIKGVDPRIMAIPAFNALSQQIGEEKLNEQLSALEYQINWGAMTLFDAVELARLLIHTTAAIQSFSVGTGFGAEFPGVGGPIDIAIIQPNADGFRWHQKKELNLASPDLA